jgi:hypothetical protein
MRQRCRLFLINRNVKLLQNYRVTRNKGDNHRETFVYLRDIIWINSIREVYPNCRNQLNSKQSCGRDRKAYLDES